MKRNTTKMDVYFISNQYLDDKTLKPRVPTNYLTENGYEDNTTKRVCLSTSVDGCLAAMSRNIKGEIFHVYFISTDVYKPTTAEVPDRDITDEVWSLKPVTLRYVYTVKVIEAYDTEYKYKTKDFEATMYKWKYKKIKNW